MNGTTERIWRESIVKGVKWVLVSKVTQIIVTNLAGASVPIVVGLRAKPGVEWRATFELGMAWVGLIPVLFVAPIVFGVWKATPQAPPGQEPTAAWLRGSLRGLVLLHGLLLALRAVARFPALLERQTLLAWAGNLVWWSLVLLALVYVRRLFVILGRPELARRTRWVGVAYPLLIAAEIGFDRVVASMSAESAGGTTESVKWAAIVNSVYVLLGLLAFVLLAGLLWQLRRVLLRSKAASNAIVPDDRATERTA